MQQFYMKSLVALFLAAGLSVDLAAQSTLFSGHVETQYGLQSLQDTWQQAQYNKLRLDLAKRLSPMIRFDANINAWSYHGKTQYTLADFVPESLLQQSVPQGIPGADSLFAIPLYAQQDEVLLDNAWVTLEGRHWRLQAGKQQIAWGSGYTWNPTDLFNSKSVVDPAYENAGVNAISLAWNGSGSQRIELLILPAAKFTHSLTAIKGAAHAAGFDLSVSAFRRQDNSQAEPQYLFGSDASGQILGLGVWWEGIIETGNGARVHRQLVAGADYTFENGVHILTEYLWHKQGKASAESYQIIDWLAAFDTEPMYLGRQYVLGGMRLPEKNLWQLSIYALSNASDGSVLVFPWLERSLHDNATLSISAYLPTGKALSEYGSFGTGGFARLRLWF